MIEPRQLETNFDQLPIEKESFVAMGEYFYALLEDFIGNTSDLDDIDVKTAETLKDRINTMASAATEAETPEAGREALITLSETQIFCQEHGLIQPQDQAKARNTLLASFLSRLTTKTQLEKLKSRSDSTLTAVYDRAQSRAPQKRKNKESGYVDVRDAGIKWLIHNLELQQELQADTAASPELNQDLTILMATTSFILETRKAVAAIAPEKFTAQDLSQCDSPGQAMIILDECTKELLTRPVPEQPAPAELDFAAFVMGTNITKGKTEAIKAAHQKRGRKQFDDFINKWVAVSKQNDNVIKGRFSVQAPHIVKLLRRVFGREIAFLTPYFADLDERAIFNGLKIAALEKSRPSAGKGVPDTGKRVLPKSGADDIASQRADDAAFQKGWVPRQGQRGHD